MHNVHMLSPIIRFFTVNFILFKKNVCRFFFVFTITLFTRRRCNRISIVALAFGLCLMDLENNLVNFNKMSSHKNLLDK